MANPGRISAVGPARPGAVILRPAQHRLMRPIFLTVFGGIWSGVVWFFALRENGAFRNPGADWGNTLFLGFFALAGLGLLLGAVHQWLALANPEPTLTFSQAEVRVGGSVQLDWTWTGAVHKLRKLVVTLEAREQVTYKRGTSTSRDHHIFHRSHPVDTTDAVRIGAGTVEVVVPADTMHSFESPNNSIEWTLTLRGEIPRWPDVSVEYPLNVLPAPRT
jgi:hypothetical protein